MKLYTITYQLTLAEEPGTQQTDITLAAASLVKACQYLEGQVPEADIKEVYENELTFRGVVPNV